MSCWPALILSGVLSTGDAVAQALPPPRDGDIRALHWELRNETEVWLTLEPKSAQGKPAPLLTFTRYFAGKWPTAPPAAIEVRAYAGFAAWGPRLDFSFVLDGGQKIDLSGKMVGLVSGMVSDYLPATISMDVLRQIAQAERVTGHALGIEFELTESQRRALRAFVDRVSSDDPAGLKRP